MSASPKQRDLIEALIKEKGVDEKTAADIRTLMSRQDATTREHISPIIDGLIALPRPVREAASTIAAAFPGKGVVNSMIRTAGVQVAKYAVPTEKLPSDLRHYAGDNSLLHVEVAEYMETRYLRILHGAPGSFSRTKFASNGEARLMIDTLRSPADQLVYTQLFGDTYSCCGVCGAELTDDTSKRLKLGPVCRTRFGL